MSHNEEALTVSVNTLREVMQVYHAALQEMQNGWDTCKRALNQALKRNESLEKDAHLVDDYRQSVQAVQEVISQQIAPRFAHTGTIPEWYAELVKAAGGLDYRGTRVVETHNSKEKE